MASLLDRLRELDGKATPGPWEYVAGVPEWDSFNVTGSVWSRGGQTPVVHKPNVTDALAIAELRNALPAVVALVEAAQNLSSEWPRDHDRSGYPAFYAALAPFVGEATQ